MNDTGWMDDQQWRDSVKVLDEGSLKGLAHPLRVRLLGSLRTDGPATATRLARRLGVNTGATSYHLRQLARHGFVAEDTERGTRRERWWRALHRMTRWSDLGVDVGVVAAESVLLHEQLADEVRLAREWVRARRSWPARWRTAAGSSDYTLRLTAEQTRALTAELSSVIERHRAAAESARAATASAPALGTGRVADTEVGSVGDADAAETDRRPVAVYVRAVPRLSVGRR